MARTLGAAPPAAKQLESEGQAGRTVHVERLARHPGLAVLELEAAEARQEVAERDPPFEARERRADAKRIARTKQTRG